MAEKHIGEIEAFDAVMRTGSTNRAAELLGITQPSISRALKRLAASSGLRLFDTVRGRLLPTPEARLFHSEVRSSFVGLDRLRARAAAIREFGTGSVKIACYPALGVGFVPRAVARFRHKQPSATVTLHVAASSIVRDLVAGGQFELGLAADEIDTSLVDVQVFGTPRAVCVVPKSHPLARRRQVSLAELARHPLISLSPEDTVQKRLIRAFADRKLEPRIVIETQYSETICNLALAGAGVGIVNWVTVKASNFLGRGLVARPITSEISFRALLITPPGSSRSRLVETFVTCLFEARNEMGFA
jgi:DNA-binding transcriptional LysR family regulator